MAVRVQVVHEPGLLQIGLLRRQLRAELFAVRTQIQQSGLQDPMTVAITAWERSFSEALRQPNDEEAIYRVYLSQMQELLRDPMTRAPLDANAMLGSDGETYGQLSLAVYALAVPEPYRLRSPLHPDREERFMVAPHPVVRHLIGWLTQHNAFLYSPELEAAYVNLLPQRNPLDRQGRIDRLMQRQAELDRLAAMRQRNYDAQLVALEQRLQRLENREDVDRLNARLPANPFPAVAQQIEVVQRDEAQAIGDLQRRVAERIPPNLHALAQRIDAHAQGVAAQIHEMRAQDAALRQRVQQVVYQMQQEIDALNVGNRQLSQGIAVVSNQISCVQMEDSALQQEIQKTKTAIKKRRKQTAEDVLKVVAIVGACVFATWALQAALAETSLSGLIIPSSGGAAVAMGITG